MVVAAAVPQLQPRMSAWVATKLSQLLQAPTYPCPSCSAQAVYTSLKETETRATDLLPYWKVPLLCVFSPRQRKAAAAVELIRETTEELIKKCKVLFVLRRAPQGHCVAKSSLHGI